MLPPRPYERITPIEDFYVDEIGEILQEARMFTVSKKRGLIEMVHLLYGFFFVENDVVSLFNDNGINPEKICKWIEMNEKEGDAIEIPGRSRNYTDCLALAEKFALERGSSEIREPDLFWAILDMITAGN